jgi:tetratricopeptide (TPR) repeat protein
MRSVVSVGLVGACLGAASLLSLTYVSHHARTRDATDLEATMRALLERGEQLWHASCPVQEVDGACLELAPAPQSSALPTHCGPGSQRAWIVVPRDAATKAAALAAFAGVIDRLGARGPATVGRLELRYDLGIAKLYEGDELREAALALPIPELDLAAWLNMRAAARDRAAAKYAEVLEAGDAKTSLAAAARSAQLANDFADELFTSAIPSSVRTGELAEDRIDAYCDALTAAAEPVLASAAEKYAACFAKANELDWFSSWSTLCERALERLEPAQYPALSELRRRPELDQPTPFTLTADRYTNGLYYAHFGAFDEALRSFEAAIAGDPSAVMPRIDAGLLSLQVRRFDVAKQLFASAVELAPTSYDAVIGLGIAQRGLGDLDGAEASYARARDLDPSRGDAYYDLAVLYKDFRANAVSDPDPATALRRSRAMYAHARELFGQFLGATVSPGDRDEAQTAIGDCDKLMKQIDTVIAG